MASATIGAGRNQSLPLQQGCSKQDHHRQHHHTRLRKPARTVVALVLGAFAALLCVFASTEGGSFATAAAVVVDPKYPQQECAVCADFGSSLTSASCGLTLTSTTVATCLCQQLSTRAVQSLATSCLACLRASTQQGQASTVLLGQVVDACAAAAAAGSSASVSSVAALVDGAVQLALATAASASSSSSSSSSSSGGSPATTASTGSTLAATAAVRTSTSSSSSGSMEGSLWGLGVFARDWIGLRGGAAVGGLVVAWAVAAAVSSL
ncbi:hypothetical protein DFJ73DRAFT_962162 [Zopfochytrium polystomum]|nr:hypothetical protein DFJ73DRAFT_962162 [Zopfochytrium polystomum]